MSEAENQDNSPFHAGERQVQARMGVRDIEAWARKVVRPFMTEEHRDFHTGLPFLVAAARDQQGRPWATLLTGPDGFITSPDPKLLVLKTRPVTGDALEGALSSGGHLGLLGIELASRRRNRVNGRAHEEGNGDLVFSVDQAFGNCPQYIRERQWRRVRDAPAGTPVRGERLSPSQAAWISSADTFFIASGHQGGGESPANGMDASHRGGEPGFVEVVGDTRLRFPDFAGNNHYNTIGNLLLDPRAGFLFVDFVTGSLLQLTGRAEIDWDSDAVAAIPGARRLVAFDIEQIIELPSAVSLRWEASAESVRSLRLMEKTRESADITSFIFQARDGGPLPLYEAGQYLPIELDVPGVDGAVGRTYSLSGPPSSERYRISVKRESMGIASRYLHDEVEVGAFVDARKPTGDLILPCDQCPVVLVSAGVGITPMAAMLHALAGEGGGRPVWFVHGARNSDHHALADEMRELAAVRPGINLHIAYSRPLAGDRLGRDYHSEGRIDGDLIRSFMSLPEAHYLLCGPTA
ncbi:MAG: pyridoxamine 5'-phosphate oxidase family protein, partial [Alphaproteobacteria bacterium]|nr:pyridoxamine 5'-phosphate oxidase family protein [Alphaproteobacteria bacterium]